MGRWPGLCSGPTAFSTSAWSSSGPLGGPWGYCQRFLGCRCEEEGGTTRGGRLQQAVIDSLSWRMCRLPLGPGSAPSAPEILAILRFIGAAVGSLIDPLINRKPGKMGCLLETIAP